MKTLHDDILRVNVLDPHHVQEHVVAQVKSGVQGVRLPFEDLLRHIWLQLLVRYHDGHALIVEASSSRTTAHLNELASTDPSVFLAIKLLNAREDNSLGRHVDTHTEGLCCEEDLEQPLLEKQLDDLFNYWKEATMMDSDASL